MKILFICHDTPNTWNPLAYRSYYAIKYFAEKYDDEIICIAYKKDNMNYPSIEKWCKLDTCGIIYAGGDTTFRAVKYKLSNLSSKDIVTLFNFYYSDKMKRKIIEYIHKESFDIIFVDYFLMLPYVEKLNIPKVLEVWDEVSTAWQKFKNERNPLKKTIRAMQYIRAKKLEKKYAEFDMCVTVTQLDKNSILSRIPNINLSVIPYGVDTDYFTPNFKQADGVEGNNVVFVGSMNSPQNIYAVKYFYDCIYPEIKKHIPNVKFYIVGRSPSKEVLQLAVKDNSVIVTGFVEDVRPYLASASVFVAPMVGGVGIKTKVLEAMAMGKAVVATPLGARGIECTNKKDMIITDSPDEFAEYVIKLLSEESLRYKIGKNARKLVIEKYSWESVTEELHNAFEEIVYRS